VQGKGHGGSLQHTCTHDVLVVCDFGAYALSLQCAKTLLFLYPILRKCVRSHNYMIIMSLTADF
jgi:hypothetical protein